MIFRRYGSKLHSVELDFDARAMNEVGFRRDRERSMDEDELESGWKKVAEHELTAEVDGPVQDEAEARLLDDLEGQLRELEADLGADQILVVENTSRDYPKTRDRKEEVVVKGKNRLHFHWRIEPPLRIGVYRSAAS